jgi:hypothetical protein
MLINRWATADNYTAAAAACRTGIGLSADDHQHGGNARLIEAEAKKRRRICPPADDRDGLQSSGCLR